MRLAKIATILTVAAVGLLLACSSEEERFAQHHEKARAYLEQGKQAEAAVELRAALQLRPQDARTNLLLARVMKARANVSDAVFYYREAQRLDPDLLEATMEEVDLILGDEPERAARLVEEALERHPEEPDVHLRDAQVALLEGDTERAEAAAREVIRLAPEDGAGHHMLGVVFEARIREARLRDEEVDEALFEQALAAFQRADALASPNLASQLEIAKVYASWPGHEEEATAAFRSAIESARELGRPDLYAATASDALPYAQRSGDAKHLRWVLEHVVEADPERIDAWRQLASVAEREDEAGAAVMERLLEARPDDIEAHLAYAEFLYRFHSFDEASAHLRETAARGIDPALALATLARGQIETERLDAARATVSRLESEHPGHPRTLLTRGVLALREGRAEEAVRVLTQLTNEHELADGWTLLATAQLQLGRVTEATASINRALELVPRPTPGMLRIKAHVHDAAHDWGAALATLAAYQKAADEPLAPAEELVRVRAFYGLDRRPVARRSLRQVLKEDDAPPAAAVMFARREGEKRPEEAVRHLEDALERHPGDLDLVRELVLLRHRLGDAEAAWRLLDETLAEQPENAALLLLRAQLHLAEKRTEEALEDAKDAFAIAPAMPGVTELLILAYTRLDRLDEATRYLDQAELAGVLPQVGEVFLARLHASHGEPARARELFEKVLRHQEDPAVMNDLAFLLAKEGEQLDRALELAQRAIELAGESPPLSDTLGFVYYKRGMDAAAIEQFRFALEQAEKSGEPGATYRYHLGLALRSQGDLGAAVAAFERALGEATHFAEAEDARRALEAARLELESKRPS